MEQGLGRKLVAVERGVQPRWKITDWFEGILNLNGKMIERTSIGRELVEGCLCCCIVRLVKGSRVSYPQ